MPLKRRKSRLRISGSAFPPTARTFDLYCHDLDLEKYSFKGKKVLDIGAGNSDFVDESKKRGASAWGVDLPNWIKWIKKNYTEKLHLSSHIGATGEKLPFKDNSMDLVVSNSFLDHAEDMHSLKILTKEALRVLRPDNSFRFDRPDIFASDTGGRKIYQAFDEWLLKGNFVIVTLPNGGFGIKKFPKSRLEKLEI